MEASDNPKISSFLVDLFSLHIIFDLLRGFSTFFLSSWFLFRCQFEICDGCELKSETKSKDCDLSQRARIVESQIKEEADDEYDRCCLLGQEINMVMDRLGIQHSLEGEELEKRWVFDEISGVFEEEPSLQEVKEAFDVFDQNRDGFIDAGELQRVLCGLGFRQGSDLRACRNMINVFDEKGDGKIDFNEFVRFMLNSF